ncbi:MAG TPA: hypothetical protein VF604_06990, partial [Pyrinomonadaceae bacterium]
RNSAFALPPLICILTTCLLENISITQTKEIKFDMIFEMDVHYRFVIDMNSLKNKGEDKNEQA